MPIQEALFSSTTVHQLKSMPRGRDLPKPITSNKCRVPYKTLYIDLHGDCFLCICDAYLPISVGNIMDFKNLEDVWTNEIARELQKDVEDQNFTWCAVTNCPILNLDLMTVSFNYQINIGMDESCNLACPTCRTDPINITSGPIFDLKKQRVEHLVKLIQNFEKPMHITMCNNGDVLASLIMRPLILNWIPMANQRIKLFTNGLLMKKLLPNSPILPYIREYQISVDAGSSEVYEQVRRLGKFSVLQDNLSWLSDYVKLKNIHVQLFYCLSSMNATDIINFSDMCAKYGFNGLISPLIDWSTFKNFNDHDVIGNINHPLRSVAIEQLRVVAKLPHISMTNPLTQIL